MATFWESAAHSVERMIFLNFDYGICNFSYFPFWFEGRIWVLIASVPGLCIHVLLNFTNPQNRS